METKKLTANPTGVAKAPKTGKELLTSWIYPNKLIRRPKDVNLGARLCEQSPEN